MGRGLDAGRYAQGARATRQGAVFGVGKTGPYPRAARRKHQLPACCANAGRVRRGLRCARSEEHTSELQSRGQIVCRLLLEKKQFGGEMHVMRHADASAAGLSMGPDREAAAPATLTATAGTCGGGEAVAPSRAFWMNSTVCN